MQHKRIAILTSGGDAPGMNAAIRAVVRKAIYHNIDIIGVYHGYQGLIEEEFCQMKRDSVAGIISRGGTLLKSARSEFFKTQAGFDKAVQNVKAKKIDALVVIGGDGSMAGAQKLSAVGIPTLVIPATIDKDISGTEYTLGFDTAVNTILDAVNKIRDTAFSHDRVAVVEVMGRHAGHLALESGIACGAEAILIPEVEFDVESVCEGLVQSYNRGKRYSIIIVAEGAGSGKEIADQIAEKTSFNPGVTVLGYLQRGGCPTATDNIVGSRMGAFAIDKIMEGSVNCLVSMQAGNIVAIPYEAMSNYKSQRDYSLHELAAILAM